MWQKFLKRNLKISKESMEAICLDGDILYSLNETEIDELTELKEEKKEILKKFLKTELTGEERDNVPKSEITINNKSSNEEMLNF